MAANKGSEKANMLNQYFSECFSMAEPPLANGDYCNIQTTGECPQDILCTEDEVFLYVEFLLRVGMEVFCLFLSFTVFQNCLVLFGLRFLKK